MSATATAMAEGFVRTMAERYGEPHDDGKRDEFSCPCCGTPTDSSYCEACTKAECGERNTDDPRVCFVGTRSKAQMISELRTCLAAYDQRSAEWDAALEVVKALDVRDEKWGAAHEAVQAAQVRTHDEAARMVGAVSALVGKRGGA